jgi:hypothetical protein
MEMQLSEYKVTIKEEMSWGDSEQIQAVIMSSLKIDANARKEIEKGGDSMDIKDMQLDGAAVLNSKVKSAECLITKIVSTTKTDGGDVEGAPVKFTREWLFSLTRSDGAKLMKAIDDVRAKSGDESEIEGK